MSDHHKYSKDSYGSSSKRYHSSDGSRMGGLSEDHYESSDGRSKRYRSDGYNPHTSSSRYADYSGSNSTGGNRYKNTATSSSSYYGLQHGYVPLSSSKYLDRYKGNGSSSRASVKSNVRRVPPPLTPPCLTSKSSSSSLSLQPLMKVSVSSNSNVVMGSSSGKEYYRSRMRQAPPEHHYYYSGRSRSHSSSSVSFDKSEFKRPASHRSSKSLSASEYRLQNSSRGTVSATLSSFARSGTMASKKLAAMARSRLPTRVGSTSRMRGRPKMMSSRNNDDFKLRTRGRARRENENVRSRSRSESAGVKNSTISQKEVDGGAEIAQGNKNEDKSFEVSEVIEGQIVVDEVAGDDDEDEIDGDISSTNKATIKNLTDKSENDNKPVDPSSSECKTADDGKSTQEDKFYGARALLKLQCPYCNVRCISFREFTFHLKSVGHTRKLNEVVLEMKRNLAKIRHEMKNDQRTREKAEKVLSDTSSYCRVCELSFRTDPKEHEANEIHNKIKTLIYRRCDVCNIDFRIWKVYIYHMAALEHAKRVAMKELQEREATGDNVQGTNLSPQELGLSLVEIRTVFYCNACIRYIPIKGEIEEGKKNHCMTLNHLKNVEDFNERERRRALREETRERARRRREATGQIQKSNVEDKPLGDTTIAVTIEETEKNSVNIVEESSTTGVTTDEEKINSGHLQEKEDDNENDGNERTKHTTSAPFIEGSINSASQKIQNEAEDDDDDEIELHAGNDDVEDESEDTGWSQRTSSNQQTADALSK